MDTWAGNSQDPITLHKYLYANADPVMFTDPTGNFSIGSTMSAMNSMMNLSLRAYNLYDNAMLFLDIARGDMTLQEIAVNYLIAKTLPRNLRKCTPANSFTANTLVSTEFGLRPIRDIKIGDKVWSYNEETGEKSLQEVVHLIQTEGTKELVDIQVMGGEVITATAEHPFYLANTNDWAFAKDLSLESLLQNINGEWISIEQTEQYAEIQKVYNLTVANDHTYFVGEHLLLVHNANKKACKFRGIKAKGFNWDDILRKHSPTGRTHLQRTRAEHSFFEGLTDKQIKARVKAAWKDRKLVKTQKGTYDKNGVLHADRLLYVGIDPKSGMRIKIVLNRSTRMVETAFPY